jgi:NADH-quinone oxidoreductase subunit M
MTGGVLQMVNHGLSTGALFLLVGFIVERRHTREISALNGLQKVAPIFAAVFTMVMLSSIAVPGLNGFVGEFLIMLGSWPLSHAMVALASMGVVLAAGYILWMVQRVLYGEVTHAVNRSLPDLSPREFTVLIPLVVLAIVMGVASPMFTRLIEPSVQSLVSETNARMRRPAAPATAAAALAEPAAGGGR